MESKQRNMKRPTFLLIGIGGVYNYGCEAIVRGTEAILRSAYPDAEIIYASRRLEDDQRRLADLQIKIIERGKHHRYSLKNICRKILFMGGVQWDPRTDSLQLLKGVDAVFSIGGDLYTLGSSGSCSLSFAKFGDAARRRDIPYILWGASVGPFSQNPRIEKFFRDHLRRLSLITARESATVDYLKELGVGERVIPCADPAFVVAPEIQANGTSGGDPFTIGVNLSPWSAKYTKYSLEESISRQARCIEELIQAPKARVILIPHVVSNLGEGDDDLRYLQKVKQAMEPGYQATVTVLESDPGFIGTKKELLNCDILVAARMHCAINALAAGIPTIFVAYSRKAVGMAQYVYGNHDWVVSLDQFMTENVLETKVQAMRNRNEEIRTLLANRIPQIRQEAYRPIERLKAVLQAS